MRERETKAERRVICVKCMLRGCTLFSEIVLNYLIVAGMEMEMSRREIYIHPPQSSYSDRVEIHSFLIKADCSVEVTQLVEYHVRQIAEPQWRVRDPVKP